MYGDFSRWSFDAARRYRRVLQHQGRVLTDADWNELNAVLAEETRLLAADLIGPQGGPKDNCAFFMTTNPNALPENHPNRAAFIDLANSDDADLFIGSGHYWVDGLLCVASDSFTYLHQPDFLFDTGHNDTEFLGSNRSGIYLAYVEVWERYITENDDPLISDPALTETCSRSQIVWQIKVEKLADEGTVETAADGYTRAESFLNATYRGTDNQPTLKAQLGEGIPVNDPCILSADARYRGRENQLYRAEIHQGGSDPKLVSWKWSRDDGSVTFPIVRLTGTSAEVEHLGRDGFSTLNAGDWVEVLDDRSILRNEPGALALVTGVERDEFLVTLQFPPAPLLPEFAENATTHPFLRRWDHKGNAAILGGALSVADAAGDNKTGKMEYGIEIQFASPSATYRTGDYWLIPARTATGRLLWPDNQSLPPQGIKRHYAPLAILQNGNAMDIRYQFAPLAQLVG